MTRSLALASLALVALGLTLAAGTVGAAARPVPRMAAEAHEHFRAGRHAQALAVFEEILAVSDHPVARTYKAWCLIELDTRLDEAAALLASVDGDPELGKLAARVPELRARLDALRRPGTIAVAVEGAQAAEARVVLDGAPVGAAPFRGEAARGPHTVRVEGPGCEDRAETLDLGPGAAAALTFRCEHASARLEIVAPEPGMAVAVDGAPRGTSPLTGPLELPPGPHVVRLEKPGFVPIQRTVRLAPGDVQTLALEAPVLVPEDGRSSVWAWTTLGAGVALVGVGAGFLIDYGVKNARAQDPAPGFAPGTVTSESAIVGGVAAGAGLGLVVASFFLWPDDDPPPPEAEPAPPEGPAATPVGGGAVVGWSGRF